MRVYLLSLLVPAHLLCLSLPTNAIALDRGDAHAQANQGMTERFADEIESHSWASFLNPAHIIETIQSTPKHVFHPTSHHHWWADATRAFVAAPKPAPLDFWDMAKEVEGALQEYVPRMLGDAAEFFKSTKFTDIPSTMDHIVNYTATFRDNIQGALGTRNVTFDSFTAELEVVFMAVMNDLENIPPPDQAPGHAERMYIMDKVLDDIALALTNVTVRCGIEEEVVTTYLSALKPHVEALMITVGDINEQYPDLFPILAFSVATLLIPESWLLRPFLTALGFGPGGPIKGSIAAWMQRYLWGPAVQSGSWFSLLQKAGMGVYPKWGGFFTRLTAWMGGLLGMFLLGSKRE